MVIHWETLDDWLELIVIRSTSEIVNLISWSILVKRPLERLLILINWWTIASTLISPLYSGDKRSAGEVFAVDFLIIAVDKFDDWLGRAAAQSFQVELKRAPAAGRLSDR